MFNVSSSCRNCVCVCFSGSYCVRQLEQNTVAVFQAMASSIKVSMLFRMPLYTAAFGLCFISVLGCMSQSHSGSDVATERIMSDIEHFGRQLLETQNQAILQLLKGVRAAAGDE